MRFRRGGTTDLSHIERIMELDTRTAAASCPGVEAPDLSIQETISLYEIGGVLARSVSGDTIPLSRRHVIA
ncbi:hypothetical protein GCM10025762_39170 [Haloechinothrix salitolerans]